MRILLIQLSLASTGYLETEIVHTREMIISQSSSHNRTLTSFRQVMRRITAITAIPQVELHAPIRLADLS